MITARAELAHQHTGWQTQIQATEVDRAELAELMEQVEGERDQVRSGLATFRKETTQTAEVNCPGFD